MKIDIRYLIQEVLANISRTPSRKVKHLQDNIKSLDIKLSSEDIEYLESIVSFEPGFPNNFVGPDPHYGGKPGPFVAGAAPMSYVMRDKPIGHE